MYYLLFFNKNVEENEKKNNRFKSLVINKLITINLNHFLFANHCVSETGFRCMAPLETSSLCFE